MAKRKRLTPARPDFVTPPGAPETKSMPPALASGAHPDAAAPISQIAGASATASALEDVTREMQRMRREGRLVVALDLDAVDAGHLVRDRLEADPGALDALRQSLVARGQQTPIEVVALDDGYGLISGWRRLTALRALYAETGDARFARVQALLRRPASAAQAYVAMVEENEVRVGLSYYERARIAVRAAQMGVYPSEREALRGLFATASRAKRSKIGSFMRLYHRLGEGLMFGAAIPERLGLRLLKAIEETPKQGVQLLHQLRQSPAPTPQAETTLLETWLGHHAKARIKAGQGVADAQGAPRWVDITSRTRDGRHEIVLSGRDVTPKLEAALRRWLEGQGGT